MNIGKTRVECVGLNPLMPRLAISCGRGSAHAKRLDGE